MTKQQVTNDDIMTALTQFAESVDQRFESVDQRLEMQEHFNLKIMQRFDSLDKRLTTVEQTMATKEDIRRIESTLDGYAAKLIPMPLRWPLCNIRSIDSKTRFGLWHGKQALT